MLADGTFPSKSMELYIPGEFWRALHQFLDRSYWKRLWTVQEIAPGFYFLDFYCGIEHFLFSGLADGVFALIERRKECPWRKLIAPMQKLVLRNLVAGRLWTVY
jgi:hypothetical protein